MGRDVRFLVFNTQGDYSKELRARLLASKRIRIVAEVDEPALLAQTVGQFHVAGVLVNLDPQPDVVLPAIAEIAAAHPNVAILATSSSTDGPLILKAMRLGATQFLPKPIDDEALFEAVDKILSQQAESVVEGKLITVTGAAGGVGATLFATNLGVELAALAEGDVVVVDLDYRFGQVATFMDIDPTFTLADLCESPEQLEPQVLDRALIKHSTGVRVLSRPTSLAEADTMTAASCVGLLSTLIRHNEYVVVDGPNRSDIRAKSVIDLSDTNLLVVQLLVPCIRNAMRFLSEVRDAEGVGEKTLLISNRVGRNATDVSIEDATKTLNIEALASIPDDWSTVSGSINLGEPLRTFAPKSKVRLAIEEIARRLHEPQEEAGDSKDQPGLIGRIFAH